MYILSCPRLGCLPPSPELSLFSLVVLPIAGYRGDRIGYLTNSANLGSPSSICGVTILKEHPAEVGRLISTTELCTQLDRLRPHTLPSTEY
jgi:hypothetical protein